MRLTMMILLMGVAATRALAAPTVPDDALALVPADVQSSWGGEESGLVALDADIEAAARALANATVDAADARTDVLAADAAVASTKGSVSGTRDSGKLDHHRAKTAVDQAKIARSLEALDVEQARDGLKIARTNGGKARVLEAKSTLATAKLDQKRAKVAVRKAKRERSTARDHRRSGNDIASERVDAAQSAASAADSVAALGGSREVAARADLALLRARREVAVATLALAQAEAAVTAGATLDVEPFVEALEVAQEDEALARASVVRVEPAIAD